MPFQSRLPLLLLREFLRLILSEYRGTAERRLPDPFHSLILAHHHQANLPGITSCPLRGRIYTAPYVF